VPQFLWLSVVAAGARARENCSMDDLSGLWWTMATLLMQEEDGGPGFLP
jgi:hypothetical protein